jgi:hypothetical protein
MAGFGAIQLNRSHDYPEEHQRLSTSVRRHLDKNWLYQYGLYEFILSRLDIIEGLQGDAQTQALALIQQARVRPLQGRGAISSETYQLYLPADTRARVTAATSRNSRPRNSNTGETLSDVPSNNSGDRPKKPMTRKSDTQPRK